MAKQYGTVKWYNETKRFGFITNEIGEDIFVHHSDINGLKLKEGDKVQFNVGEAAKGKKATDVEYADESN